MNSTSTFQQLMHHLGAGDQQAAEAVFQRFTGKLLALAQSRLDARLQQKVDPEDVLQSVFRSFFRRQENNEFDLQGWDELWALLVTFTVRKCCKQARRFHSEKRDVTREALPKLLGDEDEQSEKNPEWNLISREPTPQQALLLTELLDEMLRPFDEQGQTIIAMRLQGYGEKEICGEINRTERTVRRVISRARTQLLEAME